MGALFASRMRAETAGSRDGRRAYEFYHLLSGADLPLHPQETVHRFFDAHRGEVFLSLASRVGKAERDRVALYHRSWEGVEAAAAVGGYEARLGCCA